MTARTATAKTTTKKPVAKTTTARKPVVRRTNSGSATKSASNAPEFKVGYVPSPDKAKMYINRTVYGVEDFTLCDYAIRDKKNILLIGDTGAGKTMLGEAYASARGKRFLAIPCDVSIDPTSLIGKMMPTSKAGEFEWVDGPLTDIFRHGGVVVIDELTFATPKMAATLYSALDSRRHIVLLGHKGEVVEAHPDVLIIATGNLGSAYRGTQELNAALKNRFKIKVNWGYDDGVESQLIKFPSMREIARKLRDMVGVELMTPVSTNMLMEFEDFALSEDYGLDFAVGNFVAAFSPTEANSVAEVMELHRAAINKDLAFLTGAETADDEFEDFEFEGTYEIAE